MKRPLSTCAGLDRVGRNPRCPLLAPKSRHSRIPKACRRWARNGLKAKVIYRAWGRWSKHWKVSSALT